ncbi:MAG: CBS domain-containing protein [Acidobacteria bacterium]|jgi:CBS domain-containing protein|uniref:CBS domain-containing protein n=1 Tax=Candidatus Polarisedimenticola svalbardensis TaxID=2886004 RepID=A0A8J6XSZ8_9BACT|nr:CBS domain-containing protein [Candidatus Polarisedimenticola svalbardensis]
MQVKDLMNTGVVTVRADQSVSELFDILQEAHVKGAPVLDEAGALVGFVSQEDVMFGSLGGGREAEAARVADIMTSPAMSVTATTTVTELAKMMWRFRIHHMPVVQGDRVVGIVSSLDFCRLAAEKQAVSP